ncbi:head maturation protease, ClpP-related [Paenibacillus pabuli]|uniref:head maturation protease, ClpP-related n=1 Tax=Paenibacillus pabuli TaxID=1472 RepID=UPI0020004D34|nr:head maturation protease, ClpP-related [Paenibacillus pabuli]UPK45883.1 Clp protease ClpP [Paenibacillus pabuli]
MKVIRLSGVVVGDRDGYIYDYYGIPNISPGAVLQHLADADGDDLEIYLSSGGGNASSGSEIFTYLKEYKGFVTVKIPSLAASAATVMASGADKVLISPTAQFMIHNASVWAAGNKKIHGQTYQMLESVDEGMVNAYVAKTGRTADEIRTLMDNETFMNAQRAVELGFADEIMFASDQQEQAVASADTGEFGTMLPPEVLDKMRVELRAKGVGPSAKVPAEPVANVVTPQAVVHTEPEANKTKEVNKPMDINELKASHPEVYAQVMASAIATERDRISGLQALAKAPGAEAIVAAAIASGKSVNETSHEIVMALTTASGTQAELHKQDAIASQAAAVAPNDPTITPEAKAVEEEAQAQKEAEEVRAEIERLVQKQGGK